MASPASIAEAAERGYPTSAERKRWDSDMWAMFHTQRRIIEEKEFDALPDTDPRKLLARIESLEEQLRELQSAIRHPTDVWPVG